MSSLAATLLADGSSDAVLISLLRWLLGEHGLELERFSYANLGLLHNPPGNLADRARRALELYPCQVLFVHRDSERQGWEARRTEIRNALLDFTVGHVAVIPVRMTEAWFLFDETAIRRVAGNPRGTTSLSLPRLKDLESLPDPKKALLSALRDASGLKGRRLDQFRERERLHQLPLEIQSYAPLRVVPAFKELEMEIEAFATRWRKES